MQRQVMSVCSECGGMNAAEATHCSTCLKPLFSLQTTHESLFTPVTIENKQISQRKDTTPISSPLPIRRGSLTPGYMLARRYQIIEEVGQGGFGIVYKAWDLDSGKLVAVKQITLSQISPRDMIQATDSYNREVTLHSPLKYKSLPRVYAHFTDPLHWYLVMDYIEGETLEEYVARIPGRRVPLREALDIGIQLCDILNYLHKQSIIFRDVKPANIMRTNRGRLYLIDFGIARRYMPQKKRDTAPLGSPGYAAPEQYGTQQSCTQTDIYGLGVTLQTLLTGNEPSGQQQAKSERTNTDHLPEHVQSLLKQMMAQHPEERPESVLEVQKKLYLARDSFPVWLLHNTSKFINGIALGAIPFIFTTLIEFSLSEQSVSYHTAMFILALFYLAAVVEFILGVILLFSSSKRWLGIGITSSILLGILLNSVNILQVLHLLGIMH